MWSRFVGGTGQGVMSVGGWHWSVGDAVARFWVRWIKG